MTVDQRDSRHGADRVEDELASLTGRHHDGLTRTPERTAGDEFQLIPNTAATAVAILMDLTRAGTWSVGIGIGAADEPLPSSVRAGSGPAFIHARDAVTAAKRSPQRCAIRAGTSVNGFEHTDAEAIATLIIQLRDRRSDTGWAIADLLADGSSQRAAAEKLGISASAVSQRIRTAALATENAATATLVKLLTRLDTTQGEKS